ncbi:MAG: AbrB/MazE/SpoVT family DNA-binding domain-containing protein [Thioploca sp.]|nr:AbrB/MazE/SpoVT family DNA-binding domain-containing protein [Thioploca sp.]
MLSTAHVVQEGEYQLIKLPESIHLNAQQVFIKPVGQSLVLIPVENPWQSLFDSLDKFSEDFLERREQPEPQVREHLFE